MLWSGGGERHAVSHITLGLGFGERISVLKLDIAITVLYFTSPTTSRLRSAWQGSLRLQIGVGDEVGWLTTFTGGVWRRFGTADGI